MGSVGPWIGRTPAAATEAFFGTLQQALSCVTTSVLQGRAYHSAPTPHTASFGGANPAPVGRRSGLLLDLLHLYDLVAAGRSWRVETVGYFYDLLDREGRSIVAYHWHPTGLSPVTYPHLHVGGRTPSVDLSKAHLPTGQVSLAAVVRMTITELGVEPLRPDWREVLDRAERELSG